MDLLRKGSFSSNSCLSVVRAFSVLHPACVRACVFVLLIVDVHVLRFLFLFHIYQAKAKEYFWEDDCEVFNHRIDRSHFGSRLKLSGLSPGGIEAWGQGSFLINEPPESELASSFVQSSHGLVNGLLRELSPGPLAPEARIMPLDQAALWNCSCQR